MYTNTWAKGAKGMEPDLVSAFLVWDWQFESTGWKKDYLFSFTSKGSFGVLTSLLAVVWSNLKPIISLLLSKDVSVLYAPEISLEVQEEIASGQCQPLNTLRQTQVAKCPTQAELSHHLCINTSEHIQSHIQIHQLHCLPTCSVTFQVCKRCSDIMKKSSKQILMKIKRCLQCLHPI